MTGRSLILVSLVSLFHVVTATSLAAQEPPWIELHAPTAPFQEEFPLVQVDWCSLTTLSAATRWIKVNGVDRTSSFNYVTFTGPGCDGTYRRRSSSSTVSFSPGANVIEAHICDGGGLCTTEQFTVYRGTPPCPTFMYVAQAPASLSYQTSATVRIAYGQGSGGCTQTPGQPDTSTFTFTVNGVDRRSYFTITADSAITTSLPLTDLATNTLVTTIHGNDEFGNPVTHTDTRQTYVDSKPMPAVYPTPVNYDNQDISRCAVSCFAATYSQNTVPYFSMDAPRSVGLVYNGDHAAPRPFIHVDIEHPAGATLPTEFRLEAKVSNVTVTFLNGDQVLHFQPAYGRLRIGGQFNGTGYASGIYKMDVIVTSVYGVDLRQVWTQTYLLVVNDGTSPIARGWTLAGVQHISIVQDGAVISDGVGSATYFALPCPVGCAYTTPPGDFTQLVAGSPSGGGWTRLYPDSTKVIFDGTGRETEVRDRFGNSTLVIYDASLRPWKIQDPTGRQIILSYGTYGLASVTDPMSRVTNVTVASDSTLRAIKDPDGDSTRFSYDGNRRLDQITDRQGSVTRFVYNASSWKLDSLVLPAIPINGGASQTPKIAYLPWQSFGVPTTSTSGTPFTPVLKDSVWARVTDAEGHTTRFAVDRWGQAINELDPLNRPTTVVYEDGNGLPLQINSFSAPNTKVEYFGWDASGNLTGHSGTGIPAISVRYGAYAQPDSAWGDNGLAIRAFLGTAGRTDSIRFHGIDSLKLRFTYDAQGRVLTEKDPKGHVTRYHYHASFGSLDSTNFSGTGGASGARFVKVRFDVYGRDSATTDADQLWRRTIYDILNRQTQYFDGVNPTATMYTYDKLFLIRVKDPKGQVYRFSRNALGLVTQRFDPADTLNRYDSYRYDRDGMMIGWTNRRSQAVTYTYDAAHRVTAKSGTNTVADSVAFASEGRVAVSWNAVTRDTTYFGPGMVWVDSVITRMAGQRFKIIHFVSGTARLDTTKVLSSNTIRFVKRRNVYNINTGILDSIALDGARISLMPNGDGLGARVTLPTTPNVVMGRSFTSIHGVRDDTLTPGPLNTKLGRRYGYDADGRTAFDVKVGNTGWREFYYDSLGRITTVGDYTSGSESVCSGTEENGWSCINPGGGTLTSYDYDAAGNRTDLGTTVYSTGNRITSFAYASWTFQHDLDGNVTVKDKAGAGGDVHYYWSADGLLDSVVAGTTRIAYAYDPQGRLVRKRRNGVDQSFFLWDGAQLLAELDGTGQKRIGEYAYYPGVDRPLALITGDTAPTLTRYYRQDAFSNVVAVFKDTTLKQTIGYDAWGAQSVWSAAVGDTNRLRWKGLLWEGDSTRLIYMRARWYDPSIGRFFSEDPIGLTGGINKYVFAGDDPLGGRDPSGLGLVMIGDCLYNVVEWSVTVGGRTESGVSIYLISCLADGSGNGDGTSGFGGDGSSEGGLKFGFPASSQGHAHLIQYTALQHCPALNTRFVRGMNTELARATTEGLERGGNYRFGANRAPNIVMNGTNRQQASIIIPPSPGADGFFHTHQNGPPYVQGPDDADSTVAAYLGGPMVIPSQDSLFILQPNGTAVGCARPRP
ncbi:MAG TPA: RHS repeat-associated core domain-containing protein [Gemmatimonadales bacterium]|jgi:RHS repeat-associated protein|nr:RHS repeat-associated core domain-containing protein [Gemmatimonadales bacterium]